MQRADDLPEPVAARFGQGRRSDDVRQPKLVEDGDRPGSACALVEVRQSPAAAIAPSGCVRANPERPATTQPCS